MVIKVAVPHQFKLKVIPEFEDTLFCGQKKTFHYIGGSDILPATFRGRRQKESNQRPWDRKR